MKVEEIGREDWEKEEQGRGRGKEGSPDGRNKERERGGDWQQEDRKIE